MLAVAALICLTFPGSPAEASAPAVAVAKTSTSAASVSSSGVYWLRVTNTLYGAVEVSADGGATWHLVARVIRPATTSVAGATSSLPAVMRSSRYGIAFGVGGGKLMKLLPDGKLARLDLSAILVNMAAGEGPFKYFMPPAGSPVQQVLAGKAQALPSPYYQPQDGDVLLVTASRADTPAGKLPEVVRAVSERYTDAALTRLRAQGRKPVEGNLTVEGRLAQGEEPGAVTFLLDGQVVGIQNRPPFSMRWDTRSWENGEHLIEVRALDNHGVLLTRRKTLVMVQNKS